MVVKLNSNTDMTEVIRLVEVKVRTNSGEWSICLQIFSQMTNRDT